MPKRPNGQQHPTDVVSSVDEGVAVTQVASGEVQDTISIQPNKRIEGLAKHYASKNFECIAVVKDTEEEALARINVRGKHHGT